MNQTTWIVGGGVLVIVLAAVLYSTSAPAPVATTDTSKTDTYQQTAATITPASNVTETTMPVKEEITPPTPAANTNTQSMVTLHTSMGDITVKLYKREAPKTVENFLKLASSGFYDGVKFHRVIKGFMIQGGDPNSKNDAAPETWGQGGPGYKFADEIDSANAIYQRGYKHGILAMANSGQNTNGSQFFIMAADYPLPPLYVIFGEVTEGLPVVDAIDAVKTDGSDKPLSPVSIKSVSVK